MSVSDITLGESIRSQFEVNVHQGCFGDHLVNVFVRKGIKLDQKVRILGVTSMDCTLRNQKGDISLYARRGMKI